MEQYHVSGMTCAACVSHVEKAVRGVEGVEEVAVSLLTNSMNVEGDVAPEEVIRAVEQAGYGAKKKGTQAQTEAPGMQAEDLKDTETPKMIRRLVWSLLFLLPLLYLTMGHMMLGWPLPFFLEGNHVGMGVTELLLSTVILIINRKFFISGGQSVLHGAPNMDTLVAMGAGVSYAYSIVILYMMTYAESIGDTAWVQDLMMQFYFESAAMILTLITVGKTLESYSKGRTTDALKGLMNLVPKTATLLRDGKEEVVSAESVQVGDIFVVRPGESIPVDGLILEGESAVDESSLTGESIPVDKVPGEEVSVGTINQSGFLTCRATRVGADTTLSKIIQMVSDAAATKAPIARTADRIAGVFVPAVLCVALVTALVWLFVGGSVGTALNHAITVLVISCPCALGLATPVAIMVGNGVGAKHGILYKNAVSLEQTGRAQIIALDKTGTITSGEPTVTDLCPAGGISEEELLRVAYALEKKSEHPLAKAILAYGETKGVSMDAAEAFAALTGNGVRGIVDGEEAFGGKGDFIAEKCAAFGKEKNFVAFVGNAQIDALRAQEKTPLFFVKGQTLLGAIAVADVKKPESAQAIAELKAMGLEVVMLTGDNEKTARAIGDSVGVDHVIAGVLPDGKETTIRQLQNYGSVIMVGDGINDAPALTRADVGFAIGAGTDVAMDAADVVLVNSKLTDVSAAIRLSRGVLRNIHENLFWAFIYNVIGIPLAAGLWIPITGWTLSPMFGAAAMSLSSFCVVMNALRLNLFRVDNAKKYNRKKTVEIPQDSFAPAQKETKAKGEHTMTKNVKIEGMMCTHCEAHVKKGLEGIDGVEVTEISHEKGMAVVNVPDGVTDAQLQDAITEAGYTCLEIA